MEEKSLFQLVEKTAGPWHGKIWRCEEMTQADADAVNARIGVMQWERCEPKPVDVELAEADETIRICGGLDDYAGKDHPAMPAACQAYHAAVAEALADDQRAARFNVRSPKGKRALHSLWMGAKWEWSRGAVATMTAGLTPEECAAIDAAHDAGRAAAKNEIDAEMRLA